MSYREIGNPGRGNCAFYGFSIGLIDIIKHEQAKLGNSPTFDMLTERDQNMGITIDDIVNFNYHRQSLDVLNAMQQSLRNILFEQRKQNIVHNNDSIHHVNAYMNFSEMVTNYVENRTTSEGFNELMKSRDLRRYVVEGPGLAIKNFNQRHPVIPTAKLQEKRSRLQELNDLLEQDNLSENECNLIQVEKTSIEEFLKISGLQEACRNEIIENAFREDVFSDDGQALNDNSLVITAMQDVTRNYRWGTQEDLKELAGIFNINLHTLTNGHEGYPPTDIENRPIITMNNKNNSHWTTHLSFIGSGFQGKEYSQYTKNSVITKREIRDIMRSYTSGFMARVSTRNHIEKANEIISYCNGNDFDTNDLVRILSNYMARSEFTDNSSFKKRVDYIMARAEHYNEASPVINI